MKALILAAGFGTRLLPYTAVRPKPLFTLDGVTVLQRCIEQLIEAGCTDIIINTHHLYHQIEKFIAQYKEEGCSSDVANIFTIYEPTILDTGGAIRNVQDFMAGEPFIVINSDIVSDIDLKMVWKFHNKINSSNILNRCCATLVLHDYPIYNKVYVDQNLFIKGFYAAPTTSNNFQNIALKSNENSYSSCRLLAFTGVQVLSSEIFDHIYNSSDKFKREPFSSIELYAHLAKQGELIKAFVCKDIFWQDIGTVETYKDVAIRFAVANHLNNCPSSNPISKIEKIVIQRLAGDGSDRDWFRCSLSEQSDIAYNLDICEINSYSSVIVADHGIYPKEYIIANYDEQSCDSTNYRQISISNNKPEEIDSFIKIGNHLHKQGVNVPVIKGYDRFSGLVVLEDLGDVHLQDIVNKIVNCQTSNSRDIADKSSRNIDNTNNAKILECYKEVCKLAINFTIKGIEQFDSSWAFQTVSYSKDMILEKECRYFVEAFLQGYLKLDVKFDELSDEFELIANSALDGAFEGLMHRDMQSRNIMVKNKNYFFIDFQSARRGPFQYDLASLLIDPYVNLADEIREALLHYSFDEIKRQLKLMGEDVLDKDCYSHKFLNYEHDIEKFINCYRHCALTRNMQMLGAFANLSMNKGKTAFKQYIPVAVDNIKKNINFVNIEKIAKLYQLIIEL